MASIAMFLRSLVESVNYCRPLNHTYFSVNYARNEVVRYHDGGYVYNRRVHYDCEQDGYIVSVSIKDDCGVELRTHRVTAAEFERNKWGGVIPLIW